MTGKTVQKIKKLLDKIFIRECSIKHQHAANMTEMDKNKTRKSKATKNWQNQKGCQFKQAILMQITSGEQTTFLKITLTCLSEPEFF